MDVSVIIPTFNSSNTLETLLRRLHKVMEISAQNYEIIFVDDGSEDGTWVQIQAFLKQDDRILGIKLGRNFGQHNALLCGIRQSKYPILVTMDDDLQHPPEEIPKLLNQLSQGSKVVYGVPRKFKHNMLRRIATSFTKYTLQIAMGIKFSGRLSAFRAFDAGLKDAFEKYQGPFVSIDVLLAWGTNKFSTVSVDHCPRLNGTSNYSLTKLVSHTMNLLTGFSTLPLKFASFVGLFFTLFGMGTLSFVIIRYLIYSTSVPGFPFLASVISIFSGAQLFALGIFGEYLSRIHIRSMGKPTYVIERLEGLEAQQSLSA